MKPIITLLILAAASADASSFATSSDGVLARSAVQPATMSDAISAALIPWTHVTGTPTFTARECQEVLQ